MILHIDGFLNLMWGTHHVYRFQKQRHVLMFTPYVVPLYATCLMSRHQSKISAFIIWLAILGCLSSRARTSLTLLKLRFD